MSFPSFYTVPLVHYSQLHYCIKYFEFEHYILPSTLLSFVHKYQQSTTSFSFHPNLLQIVNSHQWKVTLQDVMIIYWWSWIHLLSWLFPKPRLCMVESISFAVNLVVASERCLNDSCNAFMFTYRLQWEFGYHIMSKKTDSACKNINARHPTISSFNSYIHDDFFIINGHHGNIFRSFVKMKLVTTKLLMITD